MTSNLSGTANQRDCRFGVCRKPGCPQVGPMTARAYNKGSGLQRALTAVAAIGRQTAWRAWMRSIARVCLIPQRGTASEIETRGTALCWGWIEAIRAMEKDAASDGGWVGDCLIGIDPETG